MLGVSGRAGKSRRRRQEWRGPRCEGGGEHGAQLGPSRAHPEPRRRSQSPWEPRTSRQRQGQGTFPCPGIKRLGAGSQCSSLGASGTNSGSRDTSISAPGGQSPPVPEAPPDTGAPGPPGKGGAMRGQRASWSACAGAPPLYSPTHPHLTPPLGVWVCAAGLTPGRTGTAAHPGAGGEGGSRPQVHPSPIQDLTADTVPQPRS